MTAGIIHLHKRFFQAAQIDLDTARILIERNRFQPALYHLQQAYEKCIKSYYILKETTVSKSPELTIYKKLKKLGHDTQESTIQILHDIAHAQKAWSETQLCKTAEPKIVQVLQKEVNAIDGFDTSLDGLVIRLNLKSNYINNTRNYAQTVKHFYDTFQKTGVEVIAQQPDQTFLAVVNTMATLYPCFYRMEDITRYPLLEFSYENLDLLKNLRQPCDQISEMLGDLFTILKPYLS